MRRAFSLLLLVPLAAPAQAPSADRSEIALVKRALALELNAAQDIKHPMRYRLRKVTSRISSTKEIIETKDGAVARLLELNGRPLSQAEEQKEQSRLESLLADPSRQRHRKQNEDQDTARAIKVLRALPSAFLFRYVGDGVGPSGTLEKFSFWPNPDFSPPDLETQVLTTMAGEIWVDAAQEHIVRLEGRLQKDVDFGWGILGRLNKGGWIVLEQGEVGAGRWRIVHLKMVMSGRVIFKTRSFDTEEQESQFEPLPVDLNYSQAIQMLGSETGDSGNSSR
ncbi:MAG TPA: hypothetical protein VGN39_10305 [Terriglobales bacterium]|nr:hypothetical protein [Terriglobales bacterium]